MPAQHYFLFIYLFIITRLRQSEGQYLKSTNQNALKPVQYSLSIGPGNVPNESIPHLSPFELEIKMADEDKMSYTSKYHVTLFCLHFKISRYFILFALEDKNKSIFHLP